MTTPSSPTAQAKPRTPQKAAKVASEAATGPALIPLDSTIFKGVEVALDAKLGRVTLTVADILALRAGSVVTLEARLEDLIELRLNDTLVARGEIVAVDDKFGVRIVEIVAAP